MRLLASSLYLLPALALNTSYSHANPTDKYILPQGAGTKDGSSWDNALESTSLQKAWDVLMPGRTLWIGSGQYSGGHLTIGSGGSAGKLKSLIGKDTGGGLPMFAGTFDKASPDKTGGICITATNGSDYWSVQDIAVRDYNIGLSSRDGGHEGVRVRNLQVTGCREGMSLSGGGTFANPDQASHDWEITDCQFRNFTKRGIRFKNGNYNFKITGCVADAGGKSWATEPFQIGFSIEGAGAHQGAEAGVYDHDITFTNCVAQNSYNETRQYWNGDGFCAERYVKNLTYKHCFAFDNTDGGWDLKAENVRLENCVSIGNKKNFRFWGQTTTIVNSLSAFSVWPGGSLGNAGLWTNGNVTIEQSTFVDSPITADDGAKVTVTNSVLARTKSSTSTAPLNESKNVSFQNTAFWDETSGQGQNPGLLAPVALWNGQGNGFNSKLNPGQGFVNLPAPMPPFTRTPFPPGTKERATPKPLATTPKTPEGPVGNTDVIPQIENGGFETDLAGWTKAKAPTWQIKTGDAVQAQKFAVITTDNRSEAETRLTGLVTGAKYELTFQSRGNTSKDARVIVRGGPGNEYLSRGVPSEQPTWTKKTMSFTAPVAEVTLQISVRAPGSFDLDDFTIRRTN